MQPGVVVAGRFQIEGKAGQGGMATVHRARDLTDGALVAIKVLGSPTIHLRELDAVRFTQEARLLAELRHPGIVRYVAHGRTLDGHYYLVTEWLEGGTLAERLVERTLGVGETVLLGRRVAEALAQAHRLGVVHRDIKPSNIFLPGDQVARARILDFGIARLGSSALALTHPGGVVGTPGYMSPEQARGEEPLDARVDVFALGCVLHECLTGRPLFRADSAIALLAKVLFQEVPRIGELVLRVPQQLDDLLFRMLARQLENRPKDAAEVAVVLAQLAQAEGDDHHHEGGHPSRPRRAVLTTLEQRLISVIMAGPLELAVSEPPPDGGDGAQPAAPADEPAAANASSGALDTGELYELHGAITVREDDELGAPLLDPSLPASPQRLAVTPEAERCRVLAEGFGAGLEWLADGVAVATLLGESTATDQAVRAARCALALRSLMGGARVALATGHGVIGDRLPLGEVIDQAAHLLREAQSGPGAPVRIDALTAGLLDASFVVKKGSDDGALDLLESRRTTEVIRPGLGPGSPFVGRERELALLEALYEECVSGPVARVAVVTAPAGTGKSRLRHELLRRLSAHPSRPEMWIARGDALGAGSPFSLVAQMVRWAAGQPAGTLDPPALKRLAQRVASAGGPPPTLEPDRVADLLGLIVGSDDPSQAPISVDSSGDRILVGQHMRDGWITWIKAECRQHPLVLVLEDLQWGDGPSVSFIDDALRLLADRPLLVLALARPEVSEVFPDLWESRNSQVVRLGGLLPRACERLAQGVLTRLRPGGELDPRTLQRIVDLSGGNPFFLEELARVVAEGGRGLPGTVVAMVAARLEALGVPARRVLRAAAVFGQTFVRGGLQALLGDLSSEELDDLLAELVAGELIRPRQRERFPGEPGFVFRHALLREGAYAMLTEEDRRLGHALAAEWLLAHGERDNVALAEHFAWGGQPQRSVELYLRAAEQALEGNDFAAATQLADRGVQCGASGEVLGRLREVEAEAANWRGDFARTASAGDQALELLPDGSPSWYLAAAHVAIGRGRTGDTASLLALAERVLPAGGQVTAASLRAWSRLVVQLIYSGHYDESRAFIERMLRAGEITDGTVLDPLVAAYVHEARASLAYIDGDEAAYCQHMEAYVAQLGQTGDRRTRCYELGNLGDAYLRIGDYPRAERFFGEALRAAEELGLGVAEAVARMNLGAALVQQGRLVEGRRYLDSAEGPTVRLGEQRLIGSLRRLQALLQLREGQPAAAERAALASAEALAGAPPALAATLGVLAEAQLVQGKVQPAQEAASRAMKLLEELGAIEEGESQVRWVHLAAMMADGDPTRLEVGQALASALTHLEQRSARISDEALRRCFREAVRENAALLALVGQGPGALR
jgi:tetratricopeptide (TPR) repeat protein